MHGPGVVGGRDAWSQEVHGPRGSAWSRGCMVLGGAWSQGVHGPGGVWSQGDAWSRGGLVSGGAWWRPPGMATAAGGTHPTGMHSCFHLKKPIFSVSSSF